MTINILSYSRKSAAELQIYQIERLQWMIGCTENLSEIKFYN